tara:strand:+ start:12555 stop:13868 length:1314 start_codon:yes stop_codon:yes gene_type:complete
MKQQPNKDPSKSFCIIPWIHLNTWPNGSVFQCCITDYRNVIGNLKNNTLEEVFNNDYMRELRKDLLEGKFPESCVKCYEQENMGITSFRQNANRQFNHHIADIENKTTEEGHVDDVKLHYWDFRFSNLCNMKCRMCGGHLSSLWNADELAVYGSPSESAPGGVVNTRDVSKENLYDLLENHIDHVEEVYFAGGEPLIMDEHYYILEKLIEKKRFDVRIRYNTNLLKLKFKKWDNIELWKNFEHVNVLASLDAMDSRGEYIRKGTVWKTIEQNVDRIMQAKAEQNVMFSISPTINLFNVKTTPEFVDWLFSKGLPMHNIHLNNVLTNPQWYHVNLLLDSDKEEIKQKFDQHLATVPGDQKDDLRSKYNSIIEYMVLDNYLDGDGMHDMDKWRKSSLRAKFYEVTSLLDNHREESFPQVFPELENFYQEAKQEYRRTKK